MKFGRLAGITWIKHLALVVLVCIGLPLQQQPAAAQQARSPRLANDWCYPFPGDSGWEYMCRISVFEGSTQAFVAYGYSPSWSRDGLRIAFTDGFGVYILDRTDDSIVSITDSSTAGQPFIFAPRWSPDGTRIAYISAPAGGAAQLLVVDADGAHAVRLAVSAAASNDWSGSYAWMPSGAAIAFGGDNSGSAELYRVDVGGSNLARLTNGAGFRGGISWSPDAARIAFNCGTTICAVDANGTNLSTLTTGVFQAAHTAVFSASNGALAFVGYQAGFPASVVVQGPDGTIVRVAPDNWTTHPRWAPDGRSLAFVKEGSSGGGACNADGSPCGSPDETFVVNADGTGLTMMGGGHHPEWFAPPPGLPLATFTSQCTGAACQFSAAGSFDPDGTIASYEWKFGDGTTASGSAPAHTYATGATYDVRLIVTDNDGLRDMARTDVTANTPPVASFSVSCVGPTCTFAGSSSTDPDGTIVRYELAFGDGTYVGGDNAPLLPVTHVYRTGTFTATLQVWDNSGVSSVLGTHTLTTTNAPPVAAFTVTCTELVCAYDASASSNPDDAFASFQWQFVDGPWVHGRTATHVYHDPGTYTVTLTVFDSAGQGSSASRTNTVVGYMHIGDLDGRAEVLRKDWNAVATVSVHAGTHGSVAGVVVSGSWDDGTVSSCTTNSVGQCLFIKIGIPRKGNTVSLTVTRAADGMRVYTPASNHDPDGDSTGSRVTIRRQ